MTAGRDRERRHHGHGEQQRPADGLPAAQLARRARRPPRNPARRAPRRRTRRSRPGPRRPRPGWRRRPARRPGPRRRPARSRATGARPRAATAITAVAAGSMPTITAPSAEVRSRRASAVNSGKPDHDPERHEREPPELVAPRARLAQHEQQQRRRAPRPPPPGRGPTKVASSSSTASRVAGSEKLKPSTPRKPRKKRHAGNARTAPERRSMSHNHGLSELRRRELRGVRDDRRRRRRRTTAPAGPR